MKATTWTHDIIEVQLEQWTFLLIGTGNDFKIFRLGSFHVSPGNPFLQGRTSLQQFDHKSFQLLRLDTCQIFMKHVTRILQCLRSIFSLQLHAQPVFICEISFQGVKAKNDLPPSSTSVLNFQAADGRAIAEHFQLDAEEKYFAQQYLVFSMTKPDK